MANEPRTLQEAIVYFANPENCLNYIAARRWKDGVTCPTCGSKEVGFIASRKVWQCKNRHPKAQFTVKVGTVMEDSPIGLDKWLTVMWMVANMKNGVSSWEIKRSLGVTQKTAWFLLHRVRLAMQHKHGGKLGGGSGEVEIDETYIGGKARNMHKDRKKRALGESNKGGGVSGKVGVQGMLERDGEIRLEVIRNARRGVLMDNIEKHVKHDSHVFTDELQSYFGLQADFAHEVINHAEAYAVGNIHTNGLENFWSLMKRHLRGTYVCVEPFHLFRYMDEQAFRFNTRKSEDSDRFSRLVTQVVGKRLTYQELTGKTAEAEEDKRF